MTRLDYAATRAQISMARVLGLITYRPCRTVGDQWRGPCPICPPPHHAHGCCFSVNLRKNLFQCFRCHRSGNALDLWVALTQLPLYPATLDLCGKLDLRPVTLENPQPPPTT
jgi:DNA primase